jgi:hypothetical protein
VSARPAVLGAATALLAAILGVLLVRFLERSGRLDMECVRIWSTGPVDSSEVARVLAGFAGMPLTRIPVSEVVDSLSTLPSVGRASAWVSPPHSLDIELQTRNPVLALRAGGATRPVSADCSMLPACLMSDTLPLVVLAQSRGILLLDEVAAWSDSSGIDPGADSVLLEEGCVVAMVGGTRVLLGTGGFQERMDVLASVSGALPGEGWTEVDLRFGGQIVLRKRGGTV